MNEYQPPRPEFGKLFEALAKAQVEFQTAKKKGKAAFATKQGGRVSFEFADLAECMSVVRGPLAKNNLCITQRLHQTNEVISMHTMLGHASGQFIESSVEFKMPGTFADLGKAITYLRRYSLCSMLGIVADGEDMDMDPGVPLTTRKKPAALTDIKEYFPKPPKE